MLHSKEVATAPPYQPVTIRHVGSASSGLRGRGWVRRRTDRREDLARLAPLRPLSPPRQWSQRPARVSVRQAEVGRVCSTARRWLLHRPYPYPLRGVPRQGLHRRVRNPPSAALQSRMGNRLEPRTGLARHPAGGRSKRAAQTGTLQSARWPRDPPKATSRMPRPKRWSGSPGASGPVASSDPRPGAASGWP